jgi:predicted dehydrogenase
MQTSPNSRLQMALIGCGGMGQSDARVATSLGAKIIAAADIYDSRLTRMREVYGADTFTSRDYREVLTRRDVDAVIVATPDHWHARITTDALQAGKHVYCQKPMIHRVEEGPGVIAAEKASGKILQIGSQYVSSHVFLKARDLYRQGVLGQMTLVESWLDRNTALGAWQYSLPVDPQPAQIDWDRFLGHAPKRPFEPVRLFRWRNYDDYGTGVAGDLFIHLLSAIHTVTGSLGPTKVYASGAVRFWKDGRDAPDVMLAILDYPGFSLSLRVNLASGVSQEQFGFRFYGSEGILHATSSNLRLEKPPRETEPGTTIGTFAMADQQAFMADYRRRYPLAAKPALPASELASFTPQFDAHRLHHIAFADSIRHGTPSIEDGTFGYRAAAPALLCNESAASGRVLGWDPVKMSRT